mmetsp:Transcript_127442/g.396710  ORF Transcript_127442/g.396710 Transcript_127442/m.396710 type:complete len:241 (+) Transcript_127442:1201-1923(+)
MATRWLPRCTTFSRGSTFMVGPTLLVSRISFGTRAPTSSACPRPAPRGWPRATSPGRRSTGRGWRCTPTSAPPARWPPSTAASSRGCPSKRSPPRRCRCSQIASIAPRRRTSGPDQEYCGSRCPLSFTRCTRSGLRTPHRRWMRSPRRSARATPRARLSSSAPSTFRRGTTSCPAARRSPAFSTARACGKPWVPMPPMPACRSGRRNSSQACTSTTSSTAASSSWAHLSTAAWSAPTTCR